MVTISDGYRMASFYSFVNALNLSREMNNFFQKASHDIGTYLHPPSVLRTEFHMPNPSTCSD